ncbi:MAG TPA: HypC/HybG/HupF family hydrogenase formation chaperone [Thermoanaerobaculia bacterium]|nr:HypC/HybG/HupF family hydrogenase formation chaperone [Thermoanaerobaculia bacterium]
MSLGFPGEVLSIEGTSAVVDCWGMQRVVSIDSLDVAILPGDFVIADAGCVVRRIPPDDVDRTLELYAAVLAEA